MKNENLADWDENFRNLNIGDDVIPALISIKNRKIRDKPNMFVTFLIQMNSELKFSHIRCYTMHEKKKVRGTTLGPWHDFRDLWKMFSGSGYNGDYSYSEPIYKVVNV